MPETITDLATIPTEEQAIQDYLVGLEVSNTNAQALVAVARDNVVPSLGGAVRILEHSLRRQAVLDILPEIAASSYTGTQIRSMMVGAMLARVKVINYATFEITYNLLKTIRDEGLAQAHPENYTAVRNGEDHSFLIMAEREAGISMSVASDVMTLGEIVLPYLQEELQIARAEVWDRINMTNLRAMVPILRYLINQVRETGDQRRPQARIIERAEMVQARWMAGEMGVEVDPDNAHLRGLPEPQRAPYLARIEDNRRRVREALAARPMPERVRGTAQWMFNLAENQNTAGFAALIGTQEDAPVEGIVYRSPAGVYTLVAVITEEQKDNLVRILRNRMSLRETVNFAELINTVRTPNDTTERRIR